MAEENKKGTSPVAVIILIVLVTIICVVLGSSGNKNNSSARVVRPTSKPTSYNVEYIVTSTVSEFDITYNNKDGNTEQRDLLARNWHLVINARSGYFAYISAQIGGRGTISCEIKLDGVVVERASSDGEYVIATCSGTVP